MRLKWVVFPLVAAISVGLIWGYPRHFGRLTVTVDLDRHIVMMERYGFPNVTSPSLKYLAIYDQFGRVFEERAYVSSGVFRKKRGMALIRRGGRVIYAVTVSGDEKPLVYDEAFLTEPANAVSLNAFEKAFDTVKAEFDADARYRDVLSKLPPAK